MKAHSTRLAYLDWMRGLRHHHAAGHVFHSFLRDDFAISGVHASQFVANASACSVFAGSDLRIGMDSQQPEARAFMPLYGR